MPIHRTLKNVVKNYTFAEVKVREATSNDPWGPSTTLMSEIADLTYNVMAFTEIMQMIWKRLNDHGKNWRHVYKSLVLLDYLLKTGSERVAQQCRENLLTIQTLKDFQYNEDGKDHGQNVREKSKTLVALLKDDERFKNERTKALAAKERFAQNTGASVSHLTNCLLLWYFVAVAYSNVIVQLLFNCFTTMVADSISVYCLFASDEWFKCAEFFGCRWKKKPAKCLTQHLTVISTAHLHSVSGTAIVKFYLVIC